MPQEWIELPDAPVSAGSNTTQDWIELPDAPIPGANKKAPKAPGITPAADGVSVFRSVFPDHPINSSKRDPTSPLGRANPDSWHNRSGAAVDIPAISGMTFEQAKKRFESAGIPILESRDEYNNPSPHATGPHWHFVFGEPKNPINQDGWIELPDEAGPTAPEKTMLDKDPTVFGPAQNGQKDDPTSAYSLYGPKIGRDPLENSLNRPGGVGSDAIAEGDTPLEIPKGWMQIPEQVAMDIGYIDNYVADAYKTGKSWDEVEKHLTEKYPDARYNNWWTEGRKAFKEAFDNKRLPRWAVNPADPALNQNTAPASDEIVVEGNPERLDRTSLENQLEYAQNNLELGFRTGTLGAITRAAGDFLGVRDDTARDEIDRRAELEAAISNNPYSEVDKEGLDQFVLQALGGLGPEVYLGKAGTVAGAAMKVALASGATDALTQMREIDEGIQNQFDFERNALNIAAGGAIEGGIIQPLTRKLANSYQTSGANVRTYPKSNVIVNDDVPEVFGGPSAITETPGKTKTKISRSKTDKSTVSKAEQKRRDIGDEVAKFQEGVTNSPTIVVHSSWNAFEKADLRLALDVKADGATKAPSFYAPDGTVHILAHNVKDAAETKGLLYHEALTHYGLDQEFGNELTGLMQSIYDGNWRMKARADALGRSQYGEAYKNRPDLQALMTEEVLAKMSENGVVSKNLWDRVKLLVTGYARKMGAYEGKITDTEVKEILAQAHARVISGEKVYRDGTTGNKYVLVTHVSPHDFTNTDEENPYGKFDHSKMGTGEGAQVYGWGTYLGENTRDAYYAKFSRDLGSGAYVNDRPIREFLTEDYDRDFSSDPIVANRAIDMIEEDFSFYARNADDYKGPMDFVNRQIDNYRFGLEELSKRTKENPNNPAFRFERDKVEYILDGYRTLSREWVTLTEKRPKTYEVDLPDDLTDKMLLWDRPLEEQPQAVKDIVLERGYDSDTEKLLELEDRLAEASDKWTDHYEKHFTPVVEAMNAFETRVWNEGIARSEPFNSLDPATLTEKHPLLEGLDNSAKQTFVKSFKEEGWTESLKDYYASEYSRPLLREWQEANAIPAEIRKEHIALGREVDFLKREIRKINPVKTGQDFYKRLVKDLGSDKEVSLYLAERGVPGNKYEDGFSRGRNGKKSYNYVMYNDSGPDAPKIFNKYALRDNAELPEKTVNKFITAMKGARILNKQFTDAVVSDRADKLKRMMAARENTKGEKGLYAEAAALKGKTQRPVIEPFRDKFTQREINSLFEYIKRNPQLRPFESLRARFALVDLMEGVVPTKSEIDLLAKVFPTDFVKYALRMASKKQKIADFAVEALNLPRALISSIDMSGMFRQGIFTVGRKEFWKSGLQMPRQFFDEKYHVDMMEEIKNRPSYPLMEKHGLEITEMGQDLSKREEVFQSTWSERLPIVGHGVKMSNRAYSGFLNKLRADMFDSITESAKRNYGDDYFDKNPQVLDNLAGYINVATGRGGLGKLQRHSTLLTAGLFSPKLISSRVQFLSGRYLLSDPVTRAAYIRDLLSFGTMVTSVLALAVMAGADVETDPRSSDFAKIRIGNTRYDITGGAGQYATLAARLVANQTKTLKGQVQEYGKGNDSNRLEVLARFTRNKLAPVPAYVANYLAGENPVGEKFEFKKDTAQLLIPLFVQDVYKGYMEEGMTGVLKKSPSFLGIGSNTFEQVPLDYDYLGRKPGDNSDKEIEDELYRLGELEGKPLLTLVREQDIKYKNENGKSVVFPATNEQVNQYQKLVGEYFRDDFREVMKEDWWKDLSDEEKVLEIRKMLRVVRQDAKADVFGIVDGEVAQMPEEPQVTEIQE